MAQLDWGSGIGIHFDNDPEYYESLGYISNPEHNIDVYTHKNDKSGAWAGQGKLHNHRDVAKLPPVLQESFKSSGDSRLSVSEYVRNLVNNHAFTEFSDPTGEDYTYYRSPISVSDVAATVPSKFIDDFYSGFNLP